MLKQISILLFNLFFIISCDNKKKEEQIAINEDSSHVKAVVAYVNSWQNNWGENNEKAHQITHINYVFSNIKESKVVEGSKMMENLWKSDIVIEGDLGSQLDIRLALYHLYSFLRDDSNLSISQIGLSS